MAFAELWLPILGAGICIASAIGAWYGGHKILAVWLAFTGVVFLLFLGALQWAHHIEAFEQPNVEIEKARAYVLVETIELINVDDDLVNTAPDKIVSAKITIKNSGQTPATNVKHRASIRFGAFPPPDDLFRVPKLSPGSVFVLASGDRGVVYAGLGRALNINEKTVLGMGTVAVYVFGEISYDSFGKRRCTHYRYISGGNVGLNGVHMAQMAEGNYIDKNCSS